MPYVWLKPKLNSDFYCVRIIKLIINIVTRMSYEQPRINIKVRNVWSYVSLRYLCNMYRKVRIQGLNTLNFLKFGKTRSIK